MKTLITAIALTVAATSASAYTCKNTVTMVNGEWAYTSSQCGNQAPASADTLAMITYIANNPPKDNVTDDTVTVVINDVVVEVPLTKSEKLQLRLGKLTTKNHALMDRIKKIGTRLGISDPAKLANLLNNAVIKHVDPNIVGNGKNEYDAAEIMINDSGASSNKINKATDKIEDIVVKMYDIRVKKNKVKAKKDKVDGKTTTGIAS